MAGHNHRQLEVTRLEGEIQRLIVARRPQEAVPLQHRATALVREIVSEQLTPGQADLRMLGALQYGLGNTLLSVDDPSGAISALGEAEQCYRTLYDDGEADMQQLIVDVKLRRARALSFTGAVTSAILESAAALEEMTPPEGDGPARIRYDLDRARVFDGNATILSDYGDPDLASESADAAIRLILHRATEINTSGEVDFYVDMLRGAATLAELLHASQGRTEVALAAGSVAVDTFVLVPAGKVRPLRGTFGLVPDFRRRQLARAAMRHGLLLVSAGQQAEGDEQIAFARETDSESADGVDDGEPGAGASPTSLATALSTARQVLGRQQVTDDLMRLAPRTGMQGSPVTPGDRCAPEVRDQMARSLADVATSAPPWSREALRIGFEANCLFALSSSGDHLDLAAWHRENARPWGRLLAALVEGCQEPGDAELAADFRTWFDVASSHINPLDDLHDGPG